MKVEKQPERPPLSSQLEQLHGAPPRPRVLVVVAGWTVGHWEAASDPGQPHTHPRHCWRHGPEAQPPIPAGRWGCQVGFSQFCPELFLGQRWGIHSWAWLGFLLWFFIIFSSVAQSCPTLWPHGLQHARPPCPSPTSRACLNSCPSNHWCHLTISSSVVPFSSAFSLSQHQGLFQWVSSSHQVVKVLELQHQSFQWIFRTDFL